MLAFGRVWQMTPPRTASDNDDLYWNWNTVAHIASTDTVSALRLLAGHFTEGSYLYAGGT